MKKNLARIKHTKNPSIPLIQKMTTNLRNKFNESICIDVTTWDHSHNDDGVYTEFRISIVFSISPVKQFTSLSWSELLDKYEELMK